MPGDRTRHVRLRAWLSKRRAGSFQAVDTAELLEELGAPGARELLDGTAAHLAYNGPDGFPRVIPVGMLWTGERIVVCTATTSPKVAALSTRPNVALTIDGGGSPDSAKSLLVRGVASLETVDGVAPEYIEMSTKSMDAAAQAEFEREVRKVYKQMVRISIAPQWARFFDYGAGRLPKFLEELVNGTTD
jgi:nitroimidazol reductase NimA-like FMN-containing flavoprotein (pyridoxamine 5'-phosphate oxidase superfamily)